MSSENKMINSRMTVTQLKAAAKARGFKGYSKLRKPELLQLLLIMDTPVPDIQVPTLMDTPVPDIQVPTLMDTPVQTSSSNTCTFVLCSNFQCPNFPCSKKLD